MGNAVRRPQKYFFYKAGKGNVADINLLLTAMLRSLGLDANPVL
jgi:transglutaminase-like putative cysteine protease